MCRVLSKVMLTLLKPACGILQQSSGGLTQRIVSSSRDKAIVLSALIGDHILRITFSSTYMEHRLVLLHGRSELLPQLCMARS